MTTNFVIAYSDIPFRATNVTKHYSSSYTTDAAFSDFQHYNTINGKRATIWKSVQTSDVHALRYKLNSGITAQPDFYLISRADLLILGASDIITQVRYSTDDSTYNVETNATIDTLNDETLIGPRSEDFLKEFTTSQNVRYWSFVAYSDGATTFQLKVGKVLLGNLFDFGYEPDAYDIEKIPASESQFYSTSAVRYTVRTDEPIYRLTVTWEGVTDDKVRDFFNNIVRWKHISPVFLYTRSDHRFLDNQRLLHCNLLSATSRQYSEKNDFNTVTATFEQILG